MHFNIKELSKFIHDSKFNKIYFTNLQYIKYVCANRINIKFISSGHCQQKKIEHFFDIGLKIL